MAHRTIPADDHDLDLEDLWEEEDEQEEGDEESEDSDDSSGDRDDGGDTDGDGDGDDDPPLGEKGEKALAAWKQRAKNAEAEAKRAKRLEEELQKLREQNMSEQERAIEEAKREGREEASAATNERLFRAELKAAVVAANLTEQALNDLLSDPTVSLRLLGMDEIPVTGSGDIDGEAISQAVSDYVDARPYLTGSARPTGGAADQGPRKSPRTKTLDERIAEAEDTGDWATARQLKLQKMAVKSA